MWWNSKWGIRQANRQQLYHQYLNEYLLEKDDENPDFVRQLTMPIYKLEELLISFSGKLYDRSVDIKDLAISDFGNPPARSAIALAIRSRAIQALGLAPIANSSWVRVASTSDTIYS